MWGLPPFSKNLSSMVPKTQSPTVSAMCHTILQQPDSQAVWKQAHDVVGFCQQKFPHVAGLPGGITRRPARVYQHAKSRVEQGAVEQPHRTVQP